MSETTMRAKLQVSMVQEHMGWAGEGKPAEKSMETLTMHAVCKNQYDETGLDEDNTFASGRPARRSRSTSPTRRCGASSSRATSSTWTLRRPSSLRPRCPRVRAPSRLTFAK